MQPRAQERKTDRSISDEVAAFPQTVMEKIPRIVREGPEPALSDRPQPTARVLRRKGARRLCTDDRDGENDRSPDNSPPAPIGVFVFA